jgi:hypothetical protein
MVVEQYEEKVSNLVQENTDLRVSLKELQEASIFVPVLEQHLLTLTPKELTQLLNSHPNSGKGQVVFNTAMRVLIREFRIDHKLLNNLVRPTFLFPSRWCVTTLRRH